MTINSVGIQGNLFRKAPIMMSKIIGDTTNFKWESFLIFYVI